MDRRIKPKSISVAMKEIYKIMSIEEECEGVVTKKNAKRLLRREAYGLCI